MNYYDKISKGYDNLHEEEQKKKIALIKQHLKPNILDVGCGTGISTPKGAIGIDPSIELLKLAKKKKKNVLQAEAEHLPFKNSSFNTVISITAVQNFTNIEAGLKEIKRVGKNNFIITTLKRSKKRKKIESMIKKLFKIRKTIEEEKDIIYILS